MSLDSDIQQLHFGNVVDLYIVDFNPVITFTPTSAGILHLTSYRDGTSNIVFDGQSYDYVGVDMNGLASELGGPIPRPSISFDKNSLTSLTQYQTIFDQFKAQTGNNFYFDWRGATVTRIRTRDVYLDGGSTPDTTQKKEIRLFVDKNAKTTKSTLEIQLTHSIGADRVNNDAVEELAQNQCSLRYRTWNGSSFDYVPCSQGGCPYGNPDSTYPLDPSIDPNTDFFGLNDVQTGNPAEDSCSKSITGCQRRFDPNKIANNTPIRSNLKGRDNG